MRTGRRRPIIPTSCGCLILFIAGIASLPFAVPYYFMRIAPGYDSAAVRSPDGKYFAYTNTHAFMDNHAVVLRLRDAKGGTREMPGRFYEGEIKWSPDSKRIAIMYPIGLGSTMIWYSIADVTSSHCVSDVADIRVNWKHDSKVIVTWRWRDPSAVVVVAEYYDAKSDRMIEKPAVVLLVADTRSGLRVSER